MYENRGNSHHNDGKSGGIPWGVAIVCLIAFWPLGLFLMFKKINHKSTPPHQAHENPDYPPGHESAHEHQPYEATHEHVPKKRGYPPSVTPQDRSVSIFLLIAAVILLFISSMGTITFISNAEERNISNLILIGFFSAGGTTMLLFRNIRSQRISRYKKYYAIIGSRDVVAISNIARTSGIPENLVRQDIQMMLDVGYFSSNAYIDSELDSFVISSAVAEAARKSTRSQNTGGQNQYMTIITELRELNNTITDIAISDKVKRIEDLTAKIFRLVEENPERLPQIRKFMSYYLPTTKKLLCSYSTLERQGIQGSNIITAKENISQTLDTLTKGFEQQLDQLFKSDVIDISADINVIENMMKQDGLTEPEM